MKWLAFGLLLLTSSCTLIGVQKIGCEGEGSANCPLGLVCVEKRCVSNGLDAGVDDVSLVSDVRDVTGADVAGADVAGADVAGADAADIDVPDADVVNEPRDAPRVSGAGCEYFGGGTPVFYDDMSEGTGWTRQMGNAQFGDEGLVGNGIFLRNIDGGRPLRLRTTFAPERDGVEISFKASGTDVAVIRLGTNNSPETLQVGEGDIFSIAAFSDQYFVEVLLESPFLYVVVSLKDYASQCGEIVAATNALVSAEAVDQMTLKVNDATVKEVDLHSGTPTGYGLILGDTFRNNNGIADYDRTLGGWSVSDGVGGIVSVSDANNDGGPNVIDRFFKDENLQGDLDAGTQRALVSFTSLTDVLRLRHDFVLEPSSSLLTKLGSAGWGYDELRMGPLNGTTIEGALRGIELDGEHLAVEVQLGQGRLYSTFRRVSDGQIVRVDDRAQSSLAANLEFEWRNGNTPASIDNVFLDHIPTHLINVIFFDSFSAGTTAVDFPAALAWNEAGVRGTGQLILNGSALESVEIGNIDRLSTYEIGADISLTQGDTVCLGVNGDREGSGSLAACVNDTELIQVLPDGTRTPTLINGDMGERNARIEMTLTPSEVTQAIRFDGGASAVTTSTSTRGTGRFLFIEANTSNENGVVIDNVSVERID